LRQLLIQVDKGKSHEVEKLASKYDAVNISQFEAKHQDVIILHVTNSKLQKLLDDLNELENVEISFYPSASITLFPPHEEAPEQVTDVELKSPIEIYLSGLQSVGSYQGFIAYAIAAGATVWTGLYTNTVFLLTAAMLISPFAGPAMNAAIASAVGDKSLFFDSIKRYFLSLIISIAVAAILSLIIGVDGPTDMMKEVGRISHVAILLPLISGMAGGFFLVQDERDSLVTGASVGVLVAASLAPPTGIIGIALVTGHWQLVESAVFLLLLQLVGIHFSAALVFRFFGAINTHGVRFQKGKKRIFNLSIALAPIFMGLLMYWQFSNPPHLQKRNVEYEVQEIIRSTLDEVPQINHLNNTIYFADAEDKNYNPLICRVEVVSEGDEMEIRQQVIEIIKPKILAEHPEVILFFDIIVLKE